MKRLTLIAAAAAASIVCASGPAYAWDCIRVSGSQQGMQQSQKSGNWELIPVGAFIAGGVEAGIITEAQGACALDAWLDAGMPDTVLLGTGVGGARGAITSGHISEGDFFVIAKKAKAKTLVDGKGIDHLEASLMSVAGHCLDGMPDHH